MGSSQNKLFDIASRETLPGEVHLKWLIYMS